MNALTTDTIEVAKGTRDKLIISTWENGGFTYVSVGVQTLKPDGEYVFKKGAGMGLRPSEARELAAALVQVANTVEAAEKDGGADHS